MHGRLRFALLLLLFLCGCTETAAPEKQPGPAGVVLGADFDEAATGTIRGTVTWQGELRDVPPIKVLGLPGNYPIDVREDQPNPNLPRIQPSTLALEDAVVFLRKIDQKRSRPWDHPRVCVEQRDRRLVIRQGDSQSGVGWVRAGDTVDVVSHDSHFHMLRARGAAFFSLPFAEPKTITVRRLDKPGVVELSSGAFFFWMRGYLLVTDHPYYARTGARGQFVLEKVPPGTYDLVCWLPNWDVAQRNRDPETGLIIQIDFQPPVEQARTVTVHAGKCRETAFSWSLPDFRK
jgi:hypothetical protein